MGTGHTPLPPVYLTDVVRPCPSGTVYVRGGRTPDGVTVRATGSFAIDARGRARPIEGR